MSEETSPLLPSENWGSLQLKLYKRARMQGWLAAGYLFIICLLLALAVVVFFFAPQVTSLDLSARVNQKLAALQTSSADLRKQSSSDTEQINTLTQKMNDAIQKLLDVANQDYPPEQHNGGKTDFVMGPPPPSVIVTFDFDALKLPNFEQIGKAMLPKVGFLNKVIAGPMPITADIGWTNISFVTYTGVKPKWENLANLFLTTTSPLTPSDIQQIPTLRADVANNNTKLNQIGSQIGDLQSQKGIADNLEKLQVVHGELDSDKKWGLLQTSVTRFGTLAVLVFFVDIISGIHRYTVRIAAFYTAQADALMLLHKGGSIDHLERLSTIFTPKLTSASSQLHHLNR